MTKLTWFRKLVLVTLCVALTTTLPLPMLDLLFRSQVAYAAPQSRQPQHNTFPIVGEGGNPLSEAMETMGTMQTMQTADLLPPELSSSLGMFGANGEPEGMLMDVGAIEAALNRAPTEPDSLANPISISRAQSAYQPGDAIDNTLLITFTVTNNRPPAVVPQVPESATITDSIAIMAEFDYSNDPNTMRNVMVVDELTANATYIASSPLPDQNGATNAWNLGDIAPLSSTSFTMTLQIPASVSDFTKLDMGATAWGTLQGRQVSAQSSPATLTPEVINGEAIGDWLKWTVDADIYDEYMLQKAAEIGQAPETLFAYVRSLGYESYSGSLRGTRGTIWSEAGNSLDQASLLIAMLRTSGIPARYRHGKLDTERTEELILSMFPEPTRVIGHIPEGIIVSNPISDTQLLAESEDHWWVEAYLPSQGGWTDLDPSFPNAAIGERFVTDANIANDGSDKIAEVPDNVRHKVTLKLKVEEYNPLNTGGTLIPQLEHSYPLTHTFNTVELVGNPVTLGHLVNSRVQPGMFFANISHTYVPYFLVGDDVTEGNPYQDLFGGIFGVLSSWVHTGVWLTFDVQDAAGNIETYEREIVDLIGFEARQGGGTVTPEVAEGNPPLINPTNAYTALFAPSNVPADVINDYYPQMVQAVQDAKETSELISSLDIENPDDAQWPELRKAYISMNQAASASQQVQLLNFAAASDFGTAAFGNSLLVKPYFDSPRILISGWEQGETDETVMVRMDLHKNNIRTVGYPGQVWEGLLTFNHTRGMQEMTLEAVLLEEVAGVPSKSVYRVFETAHEQDIPLAAISASNLDDLADLDISDEAKARITSALLKGPQYLVMLPSRSVTLGNEKTVGWILVDAFSGQTVDVMENGQHSVMIETALFFSSDGQQFMFALIGFFHGSGIYSLAFIGSLLEQVPFGDIDMKTIWSSALNKADEQIKRILAALGVFIPQNDFCRLFPSLPILKSLSKDP